jgi:hypothetical protein
MSRVKPLLTKPTPKYSICEAEAVAQKGVSAVDSRAELIAPQTQCGWRNSCSSHEYLQKQTVALAAGALLLRGGELP